MADYCKVCTPFEGDYDIDFVDIALHLENGHSEGFICEGCNIKAIYKDEEGRLYLAKEIHGEIELEETTIEKLM